MWWRQKRSSGLNPAPPCAPTLPKACLSTWCRGPFVVLEALAAYPQWQAGTAERWAGAGVQGAPPAPPGAAPTHRPQERESSAHSFAETLAIPQVGN